MRILELTNFSAGACGVWQRVFQESIELKKKGHEILILSSNSVKGTKETAKEHEVIQGLEIKRFPFKKIGGESFMHWLDKEAEKLAMEFKPDIIIAHAYRHLHTTKALKIKKELAKQGINCKIFLVTHAPFERERRLLQETVVLFYDNIIGRFSLKKFDKIIAITKWEIPYLKNLGLREENIIYIPNGIPNNFFVQKSVKEENKILYLGRISPIKNLQVLIKAISLISDKEALLELVGPAEEDYKEYLISLVEELNIKNRVIFSKPIYDLKEKIKKLDSCNIFILPSLSEGMPQSLIESMARRKIVIASNNKGNSGIIKDKVNGFLFEIKNEKQLAEVINYCMDNKNKKKLEKIKKQAKLSVLRFKLSKIVNDLERLF
ncbi:glycosyltransferase family 4 protein [Candidatus Pacearchaeota archaeon]|nr:glycosyltransferase family 4 protein [Candidatus Pacearchaeota archaeon]